MSSYFPRLIMPLILIFLALSVVSAQEIKIDGKIHSSGEILQLLEQSSLVYELGELDDSVVTNDSLPVVSNQLFIQKKDNKITLDIYTLPKAIEDTLLLAEKAFGEKNYEDALILYRKVQKLAPEYYVVLTFIGDIFFMKENYDSAKVYFEKGISYNFIDYNAHWFLADTEWELGSKSRAIEQVTIAHLLNVNHPLIKKRLIRYRNENNRIWRDWAFYPQYTLGKEGNNVKVKFHPDWIGYVLVKALWKYEPGYAENMFGPSYADQVVCFLEEKEALASLLAHNEKLDPIPQIIKAGFVNEFILYEIVAKAGSKRSFASPFR